MSPRDMRARGFTLLEVLVVLAITSMISVLLIDGVSQVLTIEQRMGERTREFREAQLRQHWVRHVIAGAVASNDHPFEMAPNGIRGLTLTPLVTYQGVPTPFEMVLVSADNRTELRYREDGGEAYTLFAMDSAELAAPPQFLALQDDGTYRTRWRSKTDTNGPWPAPQWPSGVALSIPGLEGETLWHIAIQGERTPPPDIEEMMGI